MKRTLMTNWKEFLMKTDPWHGLEIDEALRVSRDGIFDFFWAVIDESTPGLLLVLKNKPSLKTKLPKFENMIVRFQKVSSGWALVIGLKDLAHRVVFETLCRDIVEFGCTAKDPETAVQYVLLRTYKWHHMLRSGGRAWLSAEEQQGLVGELAFLRELASEFSPYFAIEAWSGPLGSPKDFEFNGCCVELKTKRSTSCAKIRISSSEQLANVDGSRLFLLVKNVELTVLGEGETLQEHVSCTAKMFETDLAAYALWEERIKSTGYESENDYEGRRWKLEGEKVYEVKEGFPRLCSPLPEGVHNVNYTISLEACSPYEHTIPLCCSIRGC